MINPIQNEKSNEAVGSGLPSIANVSESTDFTVRPAYLKLTLI